MFDLSIKIFFARILDVSLGVIRTVEIVKNNTIKAVLIAFFEVLIWYIVAREALTSEFNIIIAVCYSAGYAFGTLIGSFLSNYLIRGNSSILVVSKLIKRKEINKIKRKGYSLSSLTLDNDNKMLFIEVDNREVNNILNLIKTIDCHSYVCILDTKNKFLKKN